MRQNAVFNTLVCESPQSKPSKLKQIMLCAGRDRHSDWHLDFGHFLVLDRGFTTFDPDVKTWLLPDLGTSAGASTKLGGYVKAVQPADRPGSLKKFNQFPATSLPPNPTAAGFRHGAADTIAAAVPAEIAVHTTGHELQGLGALWNYLHGRAALLVPSAVVLAGWLPHPYGQLGDAPVHPTLQALVDAGVSLELLEMMMDHLFSFHDASPPMLLQGGPLSKSCSALNP
jgi:hypothetical protein